MLLGSLLALAGLRVEPVTAVSLPSFSAAAQTGGSEAEQRGLGTQGSANPMTRENDQPAPAGNGPGVPLFDFSGEHPAWYTVDDDVMGGRSSSTVTVDERLQRLIFSGSVSLENNGGFASSRSQWATYDLRSFDGLALRVRGDGNIYRLSVRTEATGPGVAYTALFETEEDTWQEVYVPFERMVPLYRGFLVQAAGPLDPASVRSFGLMLSDKQQGDFQLEVDWINAVAESRPPITAVSYTPR